MNVKLLARIVGAERRLQGIEVQNAIIIGGSNSLNDGNRNAARIGDSNSGIHAIATRWRIEHDPLRGYTQGRHGPIADDGYRRIVSRAILGKFQVHTAGVIRGSGRLVRNGYSILRSERHHSGSAEWPRNRPLCDRQLVLRLRLSNAGTYE